MNLPKTILIYSYPRCGSHLLGSALASHPGVNHLGEILNLDSPFSRFSLSSRGAKQLLARLQRLSLQTRRASLVIVHANTFAQFSHPALEDHPKWNRFADFPQLARDAGLPTVVLRRANLLERLSSFQQAVACDTWQSQTADYHYAPLPLDPTLAEQDFLYMEETFQRMDEEFPDALRVSYEQLCQSPEKAFTAVQHHCKIPVRPLRPKLRKQSKDIRHEIANYDALREHFEGSPWQVFFDRNGTPHSEENRKSGE